MTVDVPGAELDSGYLAVFGHQILAAVSVVSGAVETLRDTSLSPANERLLMREIDRSIAAIVESSQWMIHGGSR